ncbi:MAG: nuclear transport factor 2 family protein [Candidatus Pelethousia sp.]|nr:nuclear transport factor 2 family protein [Candidatus Pelethousia sp.]
MKENIRRYFQAWLQNDPSALPDLFSEDIIYSECYGPEYFGLEQIMRWFKDWNACGTVLKWEIKQVIEHKNVCVVEWYFECEYEKEHSEFNGVSIAVFDNNLKIGNLKEFQSKKEHTYPYGRP